MVLQDIIKRAEQLVENFDPEKFGEEVSRYDENHLEKFLLIGATVKLFGQKNKEKYPNISKVVKEMVEALQNPDLVKYSYVFFRLYPQLQSREREMTIYAKHLLHIIKTIFKKMVEEKAFSHNQLNTPEKLFDSDIQLLAGRVANALNVLLMQGVPSTLPESRLINRMKNLLYPEDTIKAERLNLTVDNVKIKNGKLIVEVSLPTQFQNYYYAAPRATMLIFPDGAVKISVGILGQNVENLLPRYNDDENKE